MASAAAAPALWRSSCDGKIVVAGADFPATGTEMFVARFNENGTLDAGFNGGIVANANAGRDASALLIQPGDKIDPLIGVARFHGGTTTGADGALDTSFGTNGAPGQRVGRRAHVVERNGRPGQEEAQRHSR